MNNRRQHLNPAYKQPLKQTACMHSN